MEISKLFGLPAHPLIVHIPVVLLPIAVLGAILIVVSPAWRARVGWLVVIAAGVSLLFVQLAIGSGEVLQESVDETDLIREHAHLGEGLRPYAAVFFVAVLALMLYDRWRARRAEAGDAPAVANGTWRDPVMATLAVVVLASAVLSMVWVYRAGHSGAESVWSKVPVSSGEGGEG